MQPDSSYPPAPQPSPQPQPTPPPGGQTPGYDFIMNPSKPPRRSILPTIGGSPLIRVIIVLGVVLILFVLFAIIKSFFTHSNVPALITVAQDQQEMIHIISKPVQVNGQPASLSSNNKAFAITAQLSLASAQSDLVTYLQNNGKKVKPKTLNQTIDLSLDKQFVAAATNNTYDQLFQQTMQNKLNEYEQALKIAYGQTKGPKGRQLLNQEFNGAQLLLKQLNSIPQ
jgi:hypothetical protein